MAGGLGTLLGPEGSAACPLLVGVGGWCFQAMVTGKSCCLPALVGGGGQYGGGGGAQVVTGPRMQVVDVRCRWVGCGLAVVGHLGCRSYVENYTVDASIFVS